MDWVAEQWDTATRRTLELLRDREREIEGESVAVGGKEELTSIL